MIWRREHFFDKIPLTVGQIRRVLLFGLHNRQRSHRIARQSNLFKQSLRTMSLPARIMACPADRSADFRYHHPADRSAEDGVIPDRYPFRPLPAGGNDGRTRQNVRDSDGTVIFCFGEPTGGAVEAGCQGTLRAVVTVRGRRAHSARSWLGVNAIHQAAPVLATLRDYAARQAVIDGLTYREGLQAVGIRGGVAGNVVPDQCEVTVNFRFAPDRSPERAKQHVADEVFDGYDIEFTDWAPGALPGLAQPAAQAFLAAAGNTATAKLGWTDVSRFAALGIPALNYGPGDPNLAHTREEHVEITKITECERVLRRYLSPQSRIDNSPIGSSNSSSS